MSEPATQPEFLRCLLAARDECVMASDEAEDAERIDLVDGPINEAVQAVEDAITAVKRTLASEGDQ